VWWLDALNDVLVAKARAMSGEDGPESSLDWDAMNDKTKGVPDGEP